MAAPDNYQALGTALNAARGAARLLLARFEYAGDRNAKASRAVYTALVAVQERVFGLTANSVVPSFGECIAELEGMVRLCRGALSPIRPCLEDALVVARRI